MSAISKRVAARYLRAQQEQGEQQAPHGAEPMPAPVAQMEQQALPKSDAGKNMIKTFLDQMTRALEKNDERGFKALLEKLERSV